MSVELPESVGVVADVVQKLIRLVLSLVSPETAKGQIDIEVARAANQLAEKLEKEQFGT